MYQCPNCGGGLKFDIPSQQLKCDHCATLVDPYSLNAGSAGAEESTYYDVTVFTCPHCGGEIIGQENSAAEFCSFCGASTVLNSRLDRVKRPNYIIPFTKTKEDCKAAYKAHIGHSFFAPRELKNPAYIDSFRGIYMPYWAYHISQNCSTYMQGTDSHRSGDYIITDHFNLYITVDAYYKGLSYDASSSFYDNISEAIAPYDVKQMRAFHPAVLSGFYADAADVDYSIYMDDAMEYANTSTLKQIKRVPVFSGISINEPTGLFQQNEVLQSQCKEVDSAMYPVWFMSYRKGKRVAYATVNGQTGKVAADFPISVGKYLLCSVLVAIPLFFLLSLLFTFTAPFTMSMSTVLALISCIIYATEVSGIAKKDAFIDDQGVKSGKGNPSLYKSGSKPKATFEGRKSGIILFIIIFCVIGIFPILLDLANAANSGLGASPVFIFIMLAGTILTTIIGKHSGKKYRLKIKSPGFGCAIASPAVSLIISIIDPASDVFYYGGVFFSLLMIVFLNAGIIRKYNVLATRRLPQFNRVGGDNRA